MLRPGFEAVTLAAILPLFAALAYGAMQILTRRLGVTDKAGSLTFYVQVTFVAVAAVIGLAIGDGRYAGSDNTTLEFLFRAWIWPTWTDGCGASGPTGCRSWAPRSSSGAGSSSSIERPCTPDLWPPTGPRRRRGRPGHGDYSRGECEPWNMKSPRPQDLVVLVSADAEWRAVRRAFPDARIAASPYGEWFVGGQGRGPVLFFHGGWGKIAAAASTQYAIERWSPSAVVNLGTCGGFEGRVERGSVVLVERTIVYDIYDRMGDPATCVAHYMTEIDLGWLEAPYPHPVIRSSILSADRDLAPGEIPGLEADYQGIVGDWESGAIAWVAGRHGLRTLILRVITDLVGRDGGESYDGTKAYFEQSAGQAMERLLAQLPDWIARIRA
jgi:adenosylhomocysteine nucleosidase